MLTGDDHLAYFDCSTYFDAYPGRIVGILSLGTLADIVEVLLQCSCSFPWPARYLLMRCGERMGHREMGSEGLQPEGLAYNTVPGPYQVDTPG